MTANTPEARITDLENALVLLGNYINLERAAKERHAARWHEGYGDNCSCWVRIGVIPDYDGHPYEEGDDAGCCGKVVQQALHAIWVCNAPEWAHTLPENTENTKGAK